MIVIKKANKSECQDVVQIFERARNLMSYLPNIHTKEETENFIKNLIESGNVFVAKIDGKTSGFIEIKDEWINHLYVDPEFQNIGVGKALVDFAKKDNTGLKLWVFENNKNAIRFYEREGFGLIEKRDKYNAHNEENLPDRLYIWKAK